MRLPVRRALSIAATVVVLGGLTATTASTANAAPADTVADCHTNAYQVVDSSGNAVSARTNAYNTITGAWEGLIFVELWYCPDYQSNFARAYWYPFSGSGQPELVALEVQGKWSGNYVRAEHDIYPNAANDNGSQDSPAYYAPVEPARACVEPLWPEFSADVEVCTEFV